MTDRVPIEDLVRRYYDKHAADEWGRHDRHRMEFAVSRRILEAHLPGSGRVLDCGGGPGRYALWLAGRGYDVTLFDLSTDCLAIARTEAKNAALTIAYEHGTATDLSRFPDASFDVVLLMGPLYHLQTVAERQQALSEARRVLRDGGMLVCAFITRTATLRYVASERASEVLDLYQPMLDVLSQGRSELFPSRDDEHFQAYFAHPTEVEPLLRSAGFRFAALYGVEGVVTLMDQINALDGLAWDAWVDLNYRVASDSTLWSAADHLLAVAAKE
jgi:S-adenosylmethionine-dependent methyltransferase